MTEVPLIPVAQVQAVRTGLAADVAGVMALPRTGDAGLIAPQDRSLFGIDRGIAQGVSLAMIAGLAALLLRARSRRRSR